MGMYAPTALSEIWKVVLPAYDSAVKAGIIGDAKHGGGYHISRNELKRRGRTNDYSIIEALDKLGDGDAASAVDTTFRDPAEMRKASKRLMDACLLAQKDTDEGKAMKHQLRALREFFGTLNSSVVTGYSLFRKRKVSSDSSHLWHVHKSIWRKFCNDSDACTDLAEVLAGTYKFVPLKKAKVYTLVVKTKVQGYYGPTKPGVSKGRDFLRKKGFKIIGTIKTLKDGRYIVTKYGTWYPLDNKGVFDLPDNLKK